VDFLQALVRHLRLPPLLVTVCWRTEFIWAQWKQHELPNLCPEDYY
jgi:hypothetical protein